MRVSGFAAFVAGVCVSCAAFAQPNTDPQWLTRPSGEDFARFYPSAALDQSIVGRVMLDCSVKLDTSLACTVSEESPVGWGFGDAALGMSRSFRMSPAQVAGVPVDSGRVRVPLRFTLDPSEPNPEVEIPADAPPDLREYIASLPVLELPVWEEAPSPQTVAAAFPERARGTHSFGRGLLSCRVNRNRSLRCELVNERPDDAGFGAAALALSRQFRVAALEEDFVRRHTREPFMLPINFGGANLAVGFYDGLAPLPGPPPPNGLVFAVYPPDALARRIEGEAIVACVLHEAEPATCQLESETPADTGFGAAALMLFDAGFTLNAGVGGTVEGDVLRFRIRFRPDAPVQPPAP